MNLRRQTIVLLLILAALVGALVVVRRQRMVGTVAVPAPAQFTDPAHGVSFEYPSRYVPSELDDSLKATGTIFRGLDGDRAILAVRHETGLGVLRLVGGTVFDVLTKNAERQLPRRFPSYVKQQGEERKVGGEKSYHLEFTYTGTDGATTIRQLQVIVVVGDNDGYFFSLQAPDAEFESHRAEFEQLLNAVVFSPPTGASPNP